MRKGFGRNLGPETSLHAGTDGGGSRCGAFSTLRLASEPADMRQLTTNHQSLKRDRGISTARAPRNGGVRPLWCPAIVGWGPGTHWTCQLDGSPGSTDCWCEFGPSKCISTRRLHEFALCDTVTLWRTPCLSRRWHPVLKLTPPRLATLWLCLTYPPPTHFPSLIYS